MLLFFNIKKIKFQLIQKILIFICNFKHLLILKFDNF